MNGEGEEGIGRKEGGRKDEREREREREGKSKRERGGMRLRRGWKKLHIHPPRSTDSARIDNTYVDLGGHFAFENLRALCIQMRYFMSTNKCHEIAYGSNFSTINFLPRRAACTLRTSGSDGLKVSSKFIQHSIFSGLLIGPIKVMNPVRI
jgi:hypothetical protein